jgi:hypothetical protein
MSELISELTSVLKRYGIQEITPTLRASLEELDSGPKYLARVIYLDSAVMNLEYIPTNPNIVTIRVIVNNKEYVVNSTLGAFLKLEEDFALIPGNHQFVYYDKNSEISKIVIDSNGTNEIRVRKKDDSVAARIPLSKYEYKKIGQAVKDMKESLQSTTKRVISYTADYISGYNSFTKSYGWKQTNIPDFDPVGAPMVCHDLLEHFPDRGAEVHSEYLALGAAHYLRHEGRYFTDITTELVPPAFGMLWYHITKDGLPIEDCKEEPPFEIKRNTLLTMQRTIINAELFVRERFVDKISNIDVIRYFREGFKWMQIGYCMAAKRYEGLDQNRLVFMYKAVQTAIENVPTKDDTILTVEFTPSEYKGIVYQRNIVRV